MKPMKLTPPPPKKKEWLFPAWVRGGGVYNCINISFLSLRPPCSEVLCLGIVTFEQGAQWFRRGGGSDQKNEIEIIVSSPLDTSCELGKDILSPNIGLKANFF
jgi:hypothetical protein